MAMERRSIRSDFGVVIVFDEMNRQMPSYLREGRKQSLSVDC